MRTLWLQLHRKQASGVYRRLWLPAPCSAKTLDATSVQQNEVEPHLCLLGESFWQWKSLDCLELYIPVDHNEPVKVMMSKPPTLSKGQTAGNLGENMVLQPYFLLTRALSRSAERSTELTPKSHAEAFRQAQGSPDAKYGCSTRKSAQGRKDPKTASIRLRLGALAPWRR